ncbi:protein NO VEIN domain-containing protein [Micromonospora sp. NPDC049460]|uniref:protein NO VEIN domain-containing protein n=1 Tax=Micromonospora sp. NPDC049460 TaxID=3364272 RepID=UPI0037BDF46D
MVVLLKHQPWNIGGKLDVSEREVEWNMWQRRLLPFAQLDVGTRVVLVSGGGPNVGMLTWEVEVLEVVKGRYDDHEHAAQLMRKLDISSTAFLNQDYTTNAPDSGWLLGWTYRPVRLIMEPRAPEHRIGRHGWGTTDALGIGGNGTGRQGRLEDPLLRRKVELAAMRKVHQWLVSRGHSRRSIRNTSANHPYDYEVGPERAPKFRVEVKGTLSQRGSVFVTAGEVRAAQEDGIRTVLAIVHGLELTLRADGTWTVHGGHLWLDEHWMPSNGALQPTQYRYQPDYSP